MHKFNAGANRPEVIVVPAFSTLWKQREDFEQFLQVIEQTRRGATASVSGSPFRTGQSPSNSVGFIFISQFSPLTVSSILGFRIDFAGGRAAGQAVGPYGGGSGEAAAGSPVTSHPVFEGCPGPGLMDWEYGNVATDQIVQPSINSLENTGPTIQIVPLGAGRAAFCTLALLDNLGRDALAGEAP